MIRVLRKTPFPVLQIGRRTVLLVVWLSLVGVILGIKAVSMGWFTHRQPLNLNGQPALVFFTLGRGCECQMTVIANAEAQIAAWDVPGEAGLPVLRVDFSRRPDLVRQYGVARAPALVLLDAQGQVVWKQDVGLSDEAPLDLATCQARMAILGQDP